MAESFGAELAEQLRRNIGDAFQAVSGGDLEWGTLLAQILGQLLVSIIYLGAFFGGYLVLISTVRLVLGKQRAKTALFIQVRSCLRYLAGLGALLFILAQFGTTPEVLKAMARAGFMAFGFYMAWLIAGRLMKEGMTRYKIDASIRQLVENLFSVIITALAVVTLLAQFGFDVVSIVAGLGIVGIAVGFAAQSTLSNFIAGITLLIERPFRIGDWVTINGQDGKVVKIALRTTWLRTRDNIFTMIPNDSVASSDIVNYSAEGVTRLNIPVGIAYKESAKAAREVLMPVLLAHPDVLQGVGMQPRVLLRSLGDSSVNLEVQVWITPDNLDVQPRIMADILEKMKEALDTAGIEIPFPHLQLFIDDAKGLKSVVELALAQN
ncbi:MULTISPECIES: mechanosensitive ion channel family protein [Marinobacter]|uniref:Small-conductance mechanosensitive channel n=1 Tax=Marinobacter salsuginis TaxID=418719 RepID=A0A5M3Q187_9GAMM|nr:MULTISPECIES: mechanosensitive ion channel family protein [Marinobacter]GBO88846.1 mechanosensitive ion channel protein MscS [Marinobacter salsuginis]SFE89644.1 Small-conductance mechanosensitive channel [Marinobacter sp. DSM 26671]